MEKIIERINEQAQKNNIQGNELGKMLGLKKSPLTDWKNNKSKPTLEQIIKMCEIFAISTEWLITGKESADLTDEEQKLIELYRNCNAQGKEQIQRYAEERTNLHPASAQRTDNDEATAQISTSAVG